MSHQGHGFWNYLLDHLAGIASAVGTFVAIVKIQTLHVLINSRLSRLLKITGTSARARGYLAGQKFKNRKRRRR